MARLLPIPRRYETAGVCRYGFHGLSYEFLMQELARIASPETANGRIILAHLGNGASLAGVSGGQCIDTSMGFTPAAGLVMGRRSGDLDPGLVAYLASIERMTPQQFHELVDHKSGLLGGSEISSDMQELLALENTDTRSTEAIALFCYQARKWIGSFAAALGYEHNRVEEPAIVLWNAGLNGIANIVPNQRIADKGAPVSKKAIERWENECGRILAKNKTTGNSLPDNASVVADRGIIKIRLRKLEQLFDSLDHSPFREKDLDRNAEEYIVDSIKEFPARAPCELVIYLDQPVGIQEERNVIAEAIHVHFARRAQVLRQNLHQLLRRGSISLAIGLSFLVTFFLLGQLIRRIMGETQWASLLRESLLIGGWVAMWKPLEILLYDCWPILGERRLYDRLSRIEVRIIHADLLPTNTQAFADGDTSSVSLGD